MKTLVLTEKPSVAREFAKALGVSIGGQNGFFEDDHYIITWAIGHLLVPYAPQDYQALWKRWTLASLPIIPENFKMMPGPKTRTQLAKVGKLLKRNDYNQIIVATDAGREGELIARSILKYAYAMDRPGVTIKRFWTSQALNTSIIKSEMQKARPIKEFDGLYLSGRARQMADWLVGINLSRLATIKMGDLFSIGRVQTAVVALLVDRFKEIENFVPKKYYELKGNFKFENGQLDAYWFDPKKKSEARIIESSQLVHQIIERINPRGTDILPQAIVEEASQKVRITPPPRLLSLTALQRLANQRFGFSALKTLELAQKLYEKHKCLSYPRTDAEVLGSSNLALAQDLIHKFKNSHQEYFNDFAPQKVSLDNRLVFNDSKLTDHHALIPLKPYSGDKNSDEAKIFDLVLRRFIMVFSKDHKALELMVHILVGTDRFRARGKVVLEVGYKNLESRNESDILLPKIEKGDIGSVEKLTPKEKMTTPPPEYTESSLLKDMVNPTRLIEEKELKAVFKGHVGLGTQATRAQTIETIIKRKYVQRAGKIIRALDKGVQLIDLLQSMEISSKVASPKETAVWEQGLQEIAKGEANGSQFMAQIKSYIINCTDEWKKLTIDPTKFAKSAQNSSRPRKKSASTKNVDIGVCPKCQAQVLESKKAYGCERWREGCKFTIWKEIAGKKISKTLAKKIIKKGRSETLSGFKSRAKKPFKASLVLNSQGQIEFDFNSTSDNTSAVK